MPQNKLIRILFLIGYAFFVWSAIRPRDSWVWLFEIVPGCVGVAVLFATYKRFKFSSLVYVLVCLHFIILVTGAKYTYAQMPLFDWLRDEFDLSRNHYDRVGHFAQGFFPVIIVREFLLRVGGLKKDKMLLFLSVCVVLALSAFYELLEMWVVLVFYPESGPQWLGVQGDDWDAQWDMTMALVGSAVSYLALARTHDNSIRRAVSENPSSGRSEAGVPGDGGR